jgi:hypothetical protein
MSSRNERATLSAYYRSDTIYMKAECDSLQAQILEYERIIEGRKLTEGSSRMAETEEPPSVVAFDWKSRLEWGGGGVLAGFILALLGLWLVRK